MNKLPQQQAMADAIRAREVANTGAPSQYMGMGGMDPQNANIAAARTAPAINPMGVNTTGVPAPQNAPV